jgi:cysteine desulfurase
MYRFLGPFWKKQKTIHLDYASTTPVSREVFRVMEPYFSDAWANPNAIYRSGVEARRVIEDTRVRIARLFAIRPQGVVFTSGGTESNNQALIGTIERLRADGRAYEDMEIITTLIEHPSILEVCAMLAKRGVRIHTVDIRSDGLINREHLGTLLSPQTVLVTFAYVNSEIGVTQEVKKITRAVRAWNKAMGTNVLVHLDAAQAPLWLPCEMDMLGVDMMSLDSGKCFGPKGVGVLLRRNGVHLAPLMQGGGQEGGLRSGTENTPLIVGAGEAFSRAQERWEERSAHVRVLRDYMFQELEKCLPEAVVNGSREHRVSNNVNISIPGIDAEFAVITLDRHGIAASTKSACGTSDSQGSYVVRALTGDALRATSTLRFTLAEMTTRKDIVTAVRRLSEHVLSVRAFDARRTAEEGGGVV